MIFVRFSSHLYFLALPHVLVLGDGVGDDDGLEAGGVDPVEGGAGEDAVGENGVDLGGARLQQLVGGVADGPAGVSHVVDQDGHAVLGVSHQDHGGHLVSFLALLVDQSELDVQPVNIK